MDQRIAKAMARADRVAIRLRKQGRPEQEIEKRWREEMARV